MMSSALAIFSGSMLLSLAAFNNMLTQSFFSQNAPTSVLQYAPAATAVAGVSIEIRFAVVAIHLLGLISVISGLAALPKAGEGRGFEALVFLSMGGIALRIGLFMTWMGYSMGPTVSSVVQKFF